MIENEQLHAQLKCLIEHAVDLRQAQRNYISSGVKGERDESKGRQVGIAADKLDEVIIKIMSNNGYSE